MWAKSVKVVCGFFPDLGWTVLFCFQPYYLIVA
jgi:hypothetical protein